MKIQKKSTRILLLFLMCICSKSIAQPIVNFNLTSNTNLNEPNASDIEGYDDYTILVDISEAPTGANVVVDVVVDNSILSGGDNPAESPADYELLTPQVTFATGGGGASQIVTIRVAETYTGDEMEIEKLGLKLSIASGTASLGANDTRILSIIDVVTLPIELVYFGGFSVHNTIELSWKTATESNNAYMAIERSRDAVHFMEIGRMLPGNGPNSLAQQAYKFVDTRPMAGLNYYRLKQVDLDGKQTFHPVVAVQFEGAVGAAITLKTNLLYQNQLGVFFNERLKEHAVLSIIDLSGRVLQYTKVVEETDYYGLDVSDLKHGYYTVLIQTRTMNEAALFVKI